MMRHFTFSGWVQNQRRFRDSVSVLELVESYSSSSTTTEMSSEERISKLLDTATAFRRSDFTQAWSDRIHFVLDQRVMETAEMYWNILAPGIRICVSGYVRRSTEKGTTTVCRISSCRLLRSSWKLNAIRRTLELLHENRIDVDEAAEALQLEGGSDRAEQIASGSTTVSEMSHLILPVCSLIFRVFVDLT